MGNLQLISFNICPFVQKSVILLKEKKIDFEIKYIDISDPPKWFLDISPSGQVPVLKVENNVVFESGVINEYLDEAYNNPLHPKDLLSKANNRAWMEYISSLNVSFFKLVMTNDEEAGSLEKNELLKKLSKLENIVKKPWFNGDDFSMVDISIAPIFVRLSFINNIFDLDVLEGLPNCKGWSERLLSRESVIESVVDGFNEILLKRLEENDSWLMSK